MSSVRYYMSHVTNNSVKKGLAKMTKTLGEKTVSYMFLKKKEILKLMFSFKYGVYLINRLTIIKSRSIVTSTF